MKKGVDNQWRDRFARPFLLMLVFRVALKELSKRGATRVLLYLLRFVGSYMFLPHQVDVVSRRGRMCARLPQIMSV